MERRQRSRLAAGVLLILIGGWFLAAQFFPALTAWINIEFSWPLIIIGVGLLILFLGLAGGEPDAVVPATIVGGIGCLLYWQNLTQNWASWAYAWTLIPGFVGLGMLLSYIFGSRNRGSLTGGLWLIFISLVLFGIFGSLLGGIGQIGVYWPVLLILLGLILLGRAILRRGYD